MLLPKIARFHTGCSCGQPYRGRLSVSKAVRERKMLLPSENLMQGAYPALQAQRIQLCTWCKQMLIALHDMRQQPLQHTDHTCERVPVELCHPGCGVKRSLNRSHHLLRPMCVARHCLRMSYNH